VLVLWIMGQERIVVLMEEAGQTPDKKQAEPSHNGPMMKAALATISPLCICAKCPSYPGHGDPKVYCARGSSPMPIDMKGCICPNCPLQKMLRMKPMYYCYYGSNRARKKQGSQ